MKMSKKKVKYPGERLLEFNRHFTKQSRQKDKEKRQIFK